MSQVVLLMCNAPNLACARAIAMRLVESRTAACVNIGAVVESVYRWRGAIESASEVPMVIKTVDANAQQVESIILELHPYELPEIIVLPLHGGLPAYLDWVRAETTN